MAGDAVHDVLVADAVDGVAAEIELLCGGRVTRVGLDQVLGVAAAAAALGRSPDAVVVVERDARVDELVAALGRAVAARIVVVTARPRDGTLASLGAFDVVPLPPARLELAAHLFRALESPAAEGARRRPRKSDVILGSGAWLKELFDRITMVAPTDVTVAIVGESGTGKELVARTLHDQSARRAGPFVVVNCAAIPEGLLEDELFGHKKGAFTDARWDRQGLLAAADGGTLFLDEIGELPMSLQAKLLRVVQTREFRRIGDDRDSHVDLRIVTATHRDLERLVADGRFREDLYYRIQVVTLRLPPLRERRHDIPLLAHHFLLRHRAKLGKHLDGFAPAALTKLVGHDFPGNIRELDNMIQHAVVMAPGPMVQPEDIPLPASRSDGAPVDLERPFRDVKGEVVDHFERTYLAALLHAQHGNLAAAARAAGMDRKNLWQLLRKHGIDPARYRGRRR
ncbi:MAG: sigma-54-dependent Fis family transcriptional regulator [Kofleriaceae bacterium]|nr:sigma-54-dependent Fis family transcriptional regulator [Myxococcales bacterium]MCB9564619.1 sigma-54-dependent Fis family transcriptional regulator [Kofleriaceae bacterium]